MNAIAALIETAKTNLPTYNAAGTPWYRATRVINGHIVQANVIGWDISTAAVTVWVDRSSEPLTLAEAAERIAA